MNWDFFDHNFWQTLITLGAIIAAYLIKSSNNLELKKPEDLKTFIKVYTRWIYNVALNIKDITAYVTKKQWLPENTENITNST